MNNLTIIVYLLGLIITFLILKHKNEVDNFYGITNFVIFIFSIIWPLTLLIFITVYLLELILPGILPSPDVLNIDEVKDGPNSRGEE